MVDSRLGGRNGFPTPKAKPHQPHQHHNGHLCAGHPTKIGPYQGGLIYFLAFNFILQYSQLTMSWWFQVGNKGTQPYMYMRPFSPKLTSHAGCHITPEELHVYIVGPCWLSTLNIAVCTCQSSHLFYRSLGNITSDLKVRSPGLKRSNCSWTCNNNDCSLDSIWAWVYVSFLSTTVYSTIDVWNWGWGFLNFRRHFCSFWPYPLQSMGSQRVGQDWATFTSIHFCR